MLAQALRSLRPLAIKTFALSSVLTFAAATLFATASPAQSPSVQAASGSHAVADRLTQPIDENTRTTLHGTVHPLANKANDRGAVSDGMKLDRIQVVLKRSDAQEAALKQLINELHTPGTANYHKWLTPDDFGKQFGPSDADVAKVETWLGSHGFSITKLNPGRQTLEIAGSAGQFRDTFHAQIHSYMVKGETRFANASDPEIPAALAPVFGGFASLNNFRLKSYSKVLGKSQYNPVTHEAKPEWTTGDSSGVFFYLAPGDFAVQYDLNPLYSAGTTGAGQSIAIVNESNINIAQVNNYRTLFGLPANPPQVIIDGSDPGIDGVNSPYGPNDASVEAYLDVELSGSVARNAQINLVIANDTALQSGLTLAMERAVYSNISPIISLSFGGCEADQGSFNAEISSLWEQAAAQGITVLVSSGDSGSANCDDDNTQYYAIHGQAVNGLASTPYNTAVGGTDFYYSTYNSTTTAQNAQLASYWNTTPNNMTPTVTIKGVIPEQPWNNSQYGLDLVNYYSATGDTATTIAGAGGGASHAGLLNSTTGKYGPYPKPSWQTGTGVPADGARDLPDLSLFAANGDNYTTYPLCAADGDCQPNASTVQISGIGGTSASTPAFAGMMALVNQKYGRQGQANYVLYPLATQFPTAFHDVTVGTNSVPCSLSVSPVECISVTSPLTVTDPANGTAIEGEIGLAAGAPAYNAGTGYDLASGLGTIDANNLVTNWGNVKFAATSTTLTPSSTSFAHGTAVTLSGAVTPPTGGTTPTGDVSLLTTSPDQSQQGQTLFTLTSNGSYSGSVNYLPGGTYSISGYYAGDGANGPSTSTPTQITVTPENSTTTLTVFSSLSTSNGTPLPATGGTLVYGQPAVLSATPAGVTTAGKSTTPTGSVIFSDGSTVINTAIVNVEGDAEYNDAPAPGVHSITAAYSGDGSYAASTSTATSFTVSKDTPTPSVVVSNIYNSSNDAAAGQTTYLAVQLENSASVNNLALAPTGVVTLTGAPTGTPTSAVLVPANDPSTGVPDGTAYFAIPSTATGSYTINFSYPGDANYNATTFSQPLNLVAQGGVPTTTTAAATPMATSPTSQVQVTVTVAGQTGHAAPTGTVYLIAQGASASASLPTSTGTSATVTLSFDSEGLPQGTNQIVVQYSGDTTYNPSATEVTIANPLSDFSLIPVSTILTIPATGPGVQTDVINLSSNDGFAGAVALTCNGAGGVTCMLGSNSVNLTSGGSNSTTLTVNVSAVTKGGDYSVVVTGTDPTGNVIHTIGLQVVTPSFTLSGPPVAIAAPGASGTSTVTVTSLNNFAGAVALTCAVTGPIGATSLPTCLIAPPTATITASASSTATLTVNSMATTTPGSYTVTITGTSGGITQTGTVVAVVGGFTLAGTAVTVAAPGDLGTPSTITVTPNGGFTGSVALTCAITASPTGATGTPTCSLTPPTVAITGAAAVTSTLSVGTTTSTTPGSYTVTVTGTSGSITQTTTVAVTVNAAVATPGTFTLTGTAVTIATQGASGTSTITITPGTTGFTGTVALTCAVTSAPSGAIDDPTCSAASASVSGTTATPVSLTINTTAQTGRLDMPLKGVFTIGGGVALAALFFFGVPMGRRGRRSLRAVRAARILSGALLFALLAGAGMGCGGGGSSSTSTPSGGTTPGPYTITVTGTSGTVTATTTVAVTVN